MMKKKNNSHRMILSLIVEKKILMEKISMKINLNMMKIWIYSVVIMNSILIKLRITLMKKKKKLITCLLKNRINCKKKLKNKSKKKRKKKITLI
jgi:hypothetical protein